MPEDDDADNEEDRDGPAKPAANGKQKRQKGGTSCMLESLQPSRKC